MKNWISFSFALITIVFAITSCNHDDPNAQLNAETGAIDTYLKTINDKYLIYDGYGDRIVIDHIGDGVPPHSGQTVKVTYTGRLFKDSTVVFASGVINDKLENISVAGLKVGISSLLKGSVATLYIPSQNAFGSAGSGQVPANTTVKYEISLDTVYRTAEELTRFKTDSVAIKKYLDSTKVNAIYHPSGFSYKIEASGTGDYPRPYDLVAFHYKLVIMSNGSALPENDASSGVFGLIDALKVGFPLMREGGKATFYVPSGLAYGKSGSGSIPANANLIFTIQLNSITK